MPHRYPRLLLAGLLVVGALRAASGLPPTNPELLRTRWPAHWITAEAAPRADYATILVRKAFDLTERPATFLVHVSGDARYRLKVNGHSVSVGPQWSAAPLWRYETVDLAPWLQAGRNVVTARVRSYGDGGPLASMGRRLGFILQGDTAAERILDTGRGWKALLDPATQPFADERGKLHTYFAIGPGQSFDGTVYPWDWETPGFDDRAWPDAKAIDRGVPSGVGAEDPAWLSARTTPPPEETPQRLAAVRRATDGLVDPAFVAGSAPFTVPARSKVTVLLDQGHLTNAYPLLTVSGGKGARVELAYAEAMVDDQMKKGNRNDVTGRQLVGVGDEFRPDGGAHRVFSPDDFRTYRYVELRIATGDQSLVVEDFSGIFTGYPFTERGSFTSDDPRLAKIWTVGWRTARLDAYETYMDCPYYEQLQYVGDTRIQCLISLYVSGDDRLMRNAIELYDRSRLPEGITQSRYPSASAQLIPTFSLYWIDMVRDYWRHRTDDAFVQARLPGVHDVLAWFERHLDPATGLLGALPYWPYMDWTDDSDWPVDPRLELGGVPPGGREGGSAAITLQYAYTLEHAAELYEAYGQAEAATHWSRLAARCRQAVKDRCWSAERKMFADTPAKKHFSQHTNTFAVLAGAIDGPAATVLMRDVARDKSITQASTYFKFYLLRAMKQAGLGNDYLGMLGPWHEMISRGLTTFAEKSDPTRSDCHAWSASPLYEFLATVCGIEPASPGFATVRIEPHLGSLNQAEGKVPHPRGEIVAKLKRQGEGIRAELVLPEGVTGHFVWKDKAYALKSGSQVIELP